MDYKIIGFDRLTGRIEVEYDKLAIANLTLPINSEGFVPTGDDLDKFIKSFYPSFDIERLKNLRNLSKEEIKNADEISKLVEIRSNLTDPIFDVTIESARNYAKNSIDGAVAKIKAKYLTNTFHQDLTYIAKYNAAILFKNNNYSGIVPNYIKLDARISNNDPKEIADTIIEKYEYWFNIVDPLLESYRVTGKAKINAAIKAADVDLAMREALTPISEISSKLDNGEIINVE